MSIDELLDDLSYNLQNNMQINYNPKVDINNNINTMNDISRCNIKNIQVIYSFINDYKELYEGFVLRNINKKIIEFILINISAWEKTGQLFYAFNILNVYSKLQKNKEIELPEYIQPLNYINEISEKINKIVLLEEDCNDEVNDHIDTLFKHYYLLILSLNSDTILSINIIEFIKNNIDLWFETKQILFAYNVMNNITELLYSGSSSINYLPLIDFIN